MSCFIRQYCKHRTVKNRSFTPFSYMSRFPAEMKQTSVSVPVQFQLTVGKLEIFKDQLHSQCLQKILFIETLNSCDKQSYSLSLRPPANAFHPAWLNCRA